MFNDFERRPSLNEEALLVEARGQLEEYGLSSEEWKADQGADVIVHLTTDSGVDRTYVVQVKQRLTPELATTLHLPQQLPALVVAPAIGEPAAERLRARGIDYVDAVGNAHLAWDGVLVDIRGRRSPAVRSRKASPRGARAFGRAGLKVGFVLLSWPEMAAEPLRRLAHASGVSVGTAKTVVDELTSAGYLYGAAGDRRLARGADLLNRWTEAYSIVLDSALSLGRFVADDLGWWKQAERQLLQQNIQVGGEAAASLLDPHLRPSSLTLYVDELPLPLISQQRMVGAEEGWNIDIRQRFWEAPAETSLIVPSTLLYADLLASGDPRQREHADRLRSRDDRLAQLDRS